MRDAILYQSERVASAYGGRIVVTTDSAAAMSTKVLTPRARTELESTVVPTSTPVLGADLAKCQLELSPRVLVERLDLNKLKGLVEEIGIDPIELDVTDDRIDQPNVCSTPKNGTAPQ